MKIAILAGHYPTDENQAIIGNLFEYGEVAPIVGECIRHFMRSGHEAWLLSTGTLQQKVAEINNGDFDIAIEIHLNKIDGFDTKGCETLYYPWSEKGKKLAQNIQHKLAAAVGNPDRGAKPGYYRMNPDNDPLYILRATKPVTVIVEPYFIDTEHATKSGHYVSEKIAFAIVAGAEDFMEETNG